MGVIHFQPSRRSSGSPEIVQMTPTSSATITLGAPIQRNSGDPEQIEEHAGGATVTGIVGVAMAPVTSGSPDFGTSIPVAIANLDTEFLGMIINGGTVQTPVAATHEGNQYGIVESSGDWYIDEADTGNVVLTVTKVLPDINAALFKFISSAVSA